MTNGGLATIRSKRSSGTGSKRSPKRDAHVGQVVELHRQRRQRDRTRVDVRRDHPVAVGGGVHRLHPAAGAEVEGGTDRSSDRRPGERGRRCADAEHVVGGQRARWSRAVVDDEVVASVAERPHDDAPAHLVAVDLDEVQRRPALDRQRRQGRRGERVGHRDADEEQPHEDIEAIEPAGGVGEGGELAPRQVRERVRDRAVRRCCRACSRRRRTPCAVALPSSRPDRTWTGRGGQPARALERVTPAYHEALALGIRSNVS